MLRVKDSTPVMTDKLLMFGPKTGVRSHVSPQTMPLQKETKLRLVFCYLA